MTAAVTTADWSVLDIDGVLGVARTAAGRIAKLHAETIEFDDAYQEALILLAQMPSRVCACASETDGATLGTLCNELHRDLLDRIKYEARHRAKHLSYELLRQGVE